MTNVLILLYVSTSIQPGPISNLRCLCRIVVLKRSGCHIIYTVVCSELVILKYDMIWHIKDDGFWRHIEVDFRLVRISDC